ncbi:TIGR04372 family glycosyltransferase [Polynucleobacter sp. AP-Feld-500C-C5]|uniref:TIGR04372 family glycosyltransferase n=1 Tax=Polynucleobacter sp. AP-Feld-500C-C5 TaxID=2576924 RepID=UPI001C0DA560|nr:TIGR04372 family glycosyltransferase [Polynucleobacter sp. AP-Feld-500C-C5]MBU3632877.1 TIGR04372 family glycosyltransferase [Polynucleobacter sp. AP-Feld-500C-C5]
MKFGLVRESIGHVILNPWLYFNIDKPISTVILFYNRKKCHSEPALLTMVNELKKKYKIILINSRVLSSIFYRISHSRFMPRFLLDRYLANTYSIHHSNEFKEYGTRYRMWYENFPVPNCDAIPQHQEAFVQWAHENNLKKPYVCVFSRDSEYHGDKVVDTYRNSDFKTLLPSIEYLVEMGYQVVRVGRNHVEDEIELPAGSYIDFDDTNTEDKSIDLMLIKNCEFLLTSNSGIICVGLMFNKKILIHNWFPIGIKPQFSQGIYILKKYCENGKIIPFKKIPKGMLLEENGAILRSNGLEVVDNTSDEILELVSSQVISDHSNAIDIRAPFIVYGGYSKLSKTWYENNQNIF